MPAPLTMIDIQHTVVIQRPLREVWAFVTDILNFPRWMGEIIKESWATDPRPLGVGYTFAQVAQFMGRRVETQFVVTEYERERRFCVQATSGPIPFTGCYTFEAVTGGTRFTNQSMVSPGTIIRLAEPILTGMVRRQVQLDTLYLKSLLEG